MELICPSCEARYQVPAGSIGEKGRQVSCMSCGHVWHAYPPLVLGTQETAASPNRGLTYTGSDGPERPSGPKPVLVDPDTPAETAEKKPQLAGEDTPAPMRADQSRSEQLAEIREMLAEVQSEDRAAAVLAPAAAASAAAITETTSKAPAKEPEPNDPPRESLTAPVMTSSSEAHQVDPRIAAESRRKQEDAQLKEEEAYRERTSRQSNRPQQAKATDVKKLQRSHSRRIRREKAKAKAGSGAFLTGLLLVAIIAAVMISLYILHPQIIERMPGTEAALTKYVTTIDGVRVSLAETFGGLQEWLSAALSDDDG
ncbi:MAG: zinc-ribbon domain-containing protein [Pseudomonadota bacterium]